MIDVMTAAFQGFQTGRLVESLIFLTVLWVKIKPHLKKADERMAGIELSIAGINKTVTAGFLAGENRFSKIESRLDIIELHGDDQGHKQIKNPQEGNSGKTI